MDIQEAMEIFQEAIEVSFKHIKLGKDYFQKSNYAMAIHEFTKVIEYSSEEKDLLLAVKVGIPLEIVRIYISNVQLAYSTRSVCYSFIGEKEKGAADMAMAKELIAEMEKKGAADMAMFEKLEAEIKNYDPPASNHISEKKEPAPQSTSSISSKNDSDDEIKKLEEVLKKCIEHQKLGNYYLQESNYAMAIREFTKVIKIVSPEKDSAIMFGLPPKIIKVYIENLQSAYLGRAISYNAIDEKEKGAADTAMAEELKAEMKNYDPPASNHISEKKEPVPKPTYSNSNTNSGDDVPLSKALFWTAIVIFIISALIAYFTGISFGKSLLITAVGIFGLIIWCGSKFSK